MTRDFEYITDSDADRIAVLENRAAELERRLLAATQPGRASVWGNVATPGDGASAVRVRCTGCLKVCKKGPIVAVLPDATLYRKVRPADVASLIDGLVAPAPPEVPAPEE